MKLHLTISRRAVLAGFAVASGAVLLLLARRVPGSRAEDSVATLELVKGPFTREVIARGTLRSARATPVLAPPESGRSEKIAFLARDGAVVRAGETVVRFDPYEAEKEAADGRSDLSAAESKLAKTQAEGGRNQRALALDRDLAAEELDRARSFAPDDAQIFSRKEIIEGRIDRSLFEKKAELLGGRLEASGRLSAAERALVEIEAEKARLKLRKAERSLRSLHIEAPHDGLLVLVRNWRGEPPQVGDALWPGQKVAEIPDLGSLEARVHVLEADAAGLQAGLPARLSIEGLPGPSWQAKLARVEAVAKPIERGLPVKYFEATLSIERADARLMRPGQRVAAAIRLEEASEVLAIPRGALFEKDGRRVVYKKVGAHFVPVDVSVGRNSLSRVVVERGLSPGDRIALRDPALRAERLLGTLAPSVSSPARP